MKKHILDRVDRDDLNAYEWDFSVWIIQAYPGSPKLYCKPGKLEKVLMSEMYEDCFGNEQAEERDPIIITSGTLTVADFPIKDFTGF